MSDPYCNFYVGQKVVFKPRHPEAYERGRLDLAGLFTFPVPGQVYHIRAIFVDTGLHRVGLRLVEIVNPEQQFFDGVKEPGFWHCNFRPATDISELEKLLASLKRLEPAR